MRRYVSFVLRVTALRTARSRMEFLRSLSRTGPCRATISLCLNAQARSTQACRAKVRQRLSGPFLIYLRSFVAYQLRLVCSQLKCRCCGLVLHLDFARKIAPQPAEKFVLRTHATSSTHCESEPAVDAASGTVIGRARSVSAVSGKQTPLRLRQGLEHG